MRNKDTDKREILSLAKTRGTEGITKAAINHSYPLSKEQLKTALLELRTEGKLFTTGSKIGMELLFFSTSCFPEKTEEEMASNFAQRKARAEEDNPQKRILQALEEISQETGGGLTSKYLAQKAGVTQTVAASFIHGHKGKTIWGFKITQLGRGEFTVTKNGQDSTPELPFPKTEAPKPPKQEPTPLIGEFERGFELGAKQGFELAYKLLSEKLKG